MSKLVEFIASCNMPRSKETGFNEFVASVLREIYSVKGKKSFEKDKVFNMLVEWQDKKKYPLKKQLKKFFSDVEKGAQLNALIETICRETKLIHRDSHGEGIKLGKRAVAILEEEKGGGFIGKKGAEDEGIKLLKRPKSSALIVRYLQKDLSKKKKTFTIEEFNTRIGYLKGFRDGEINYSLKSRIVSFNLDIFPNGEKDIQKAVINYEKVFGSIDNLFDKLVEEGIVIQASKRGYYVFDVLKTVVFKK